MYGKIKARMRTILDDFSSSRSFTNYGEFRPVVTINFKTTTRYFGGEEKKNNKTNT